MTDSVTNRVVQPPRSVADIPSLVNKFDAEDLLLVDRQQGCSTFSRLNEQALRDGIWRNRHTLSRFSG